MTVQNLAEFNAALRSFGEKDVPQAAVVLQKAVALEMLSRLVEKTRVKTGRARGGYQVTIGQPASGDTGALDQAGDRTIAAGLASISNLPPFVNVFITNNVEYSGFLNDRYRMLELSLQEVGVVFQ